MSDLKLLAVDADDLAVISASCQDAVLRAGDMAFAKTDARFALMMNRFAWEAGATIRKRAALHFERVTAVRHRGIDLNTQEGVLVLLAITFEPDEAPAGAIELAFAGGGVVRLTVECLEARLSDLGAAWAAKSVPAHTL